MAILEEFFVLVGERKIGLQHNRLEAQPASGGGDCANGRMEQGLTSRKVEHPHLFSNFFKERQHICQRGFRGSSRGQPVPRDRGKVGPVGNVVSDTERLEETLSTLGLARTIWG